MGLPASDTGINFEPTEEGVHEAFCYGVIDLGTHYNDHFSKSVRKVLIMWELKDLMIEVEEDGGTVEKPRVISKDYTLSLDQRAILRKDLESWRGKSFTAEELEGFDLENLIGVPASIQVIHKIREGKKPYAIVNNVLPLKMEKNKIKLFNDNFFFSFFDDHNLPPGLPEWIRDKIKASDEWKERAGAFNGSDGSGTDNDHSDIPF